MVENTPDEQVIDSRVEYWVAGMRSGEDEIYQQLAENYEYYLSNIGSFEDGELNYTELPNFTRETNTVLHVAIQFGTVWAKEATVYVVTGEDEKFRNVYGHEETANREVQNTDYCEVHRTTPIGSSVEKRFNFLRNDEAEVIRAIGENLEFLYERREDLETTPGSVIESMPNFDRALNTILVYSALFGRLWECSNPSLWVVLDEDGAYHGIHGTPESAAWEQQAHDRGRVEAVTPPDNDRYADDRSVGK